MNDSPSDRSSAARCACTSTLTCSSRRSTRCLRSASHRVRVTSASSVLAQANPNTNTKTPTLIFFRCTSQDVCCKRKSRDRNISVAAPRTSAACCIRLRAPHDLAADSNCDSPLNQRDVVTTAWTGEGPRSAGRVRATASPRYQSSPAARSSRNAATGRMSIPSSVRRRFVSRHTTTRRRTRG